MSIYKKLYELVDQKNFKQEFLQVFNVCEKNSNITFKAHNDCVLPVGAFCENGTMDVNFNGEKYSVEIGQRNKYFRLKAGERIDLRGHVPLIVGNRINLNQEIKHKQKLVLLIIIDNLAQTLLDEYGLSVLMPYTDKFFSDAIHVHNCYSCSDWTLPGVATIFTGKYSCEHGLLHPKGGRLSGKCITDVFGAAGYMTSIFNSSWRMHPDYGYYDNIDRGIYVKGVVKGRFMDLFEDMMNHLHAFGNRDHFVVLSIYDLHDHWITDVSRDISMQVQENMVEACHKEPNEMKSVNKTYSPIVKEIYARAIKQLDSRLLFLYEFLRHNYADDEYTVVLSADHGNSYVSPPDFPSLSENLGGWPYFQECMMKVPLMIKTPYNQRTDIYGISENRKIFDALASLLSNQEEESSDEKIRSYFDGDYAYNESIYPGSTYKAKIIDGKHIFYYETYSVVDNMCKLQGQEGKGLLLEKGSGNVTKDLKTEKKFEELVRDHLKKIEVS